jgi:hypothetical protein
MKIAADLMKIAILQLGVVFKQHTVVEQWVEGTGYPHNKNMLPGGVLYRHRVCAGFYVSIEGFDLT